MTIMNGNTREKISPPGVFVPVPTFFKSASSNNTSAAVDVETQVKHSIHLAKSGIKGLVLLGSTGEAVHLSQQERIDLVSGVRKGLEQAGINDYPIMAGVLTNSVEDAVNELHAMAKAGADWGLVLAPGYFGSVANQENLVQWYTRVAEESPIGILIYNYPGVTNGVVVAPETYFKLAANPKIVGCKMSHGNMSHHLQVSLAPEIDHSKFSLYSGFGQQLFPVVSCGGAGVIDGLAAIYPNVVVNLFNAANAAPPIDADRLNLIRKLQWNVSRGNEAIGSFGIVGIKEAIFREQHLGTLEGGRLPLKGKLPHGLWDGNRETFDRLRELEASLSKEKSA